MQRVIQSDKHNQPGPACFFCAQPLSSGDLFRHQVEREEWHFPSPLNIALDEKRLMFFEPVPRCQSCVHKTVEAIVVERLTQVGPLRSEERIVPWITTHYVALSPPTSFSTMVHGGTVAAIGLTQPWLAQNATTWWKRLIQPVRRLWRGMLLTLALGLLYLWLYLAQP